jgi:DASH complex subunit DAD3
MSSTPPPPTASASAALSPLEQQLLNEYTKLLDNLHRVLPPPNTHTPANTTQLSAASAKLGNAPAAEMMDSLRMLERKTGLVFTLLKASVYSMVLQHQMNTELEEEDRYRG